MPRMKRVEVIAASGFVERMRELGHNWPCSAEDLERDGTLRLVGLSLWRHFGDEYRKHMHHARCTVDIEGRVIGNCSTSDPRLFLQVEVIV